MDKQSLLPLPMVHSDLDEHGLDPYEFRIYAHIVRRTGGKLDGECFAKLKKISEVCHMSNSQKKPLVCASGFFVIPSWDKSKLLTLCPLLLFQTRAYQNCAETGTELVRFTAKEPPKS